MQITTNTTDVVVSLEKAVERIEGALVSMLANFASDIARLASESTKLGSDESIEYGRSNKGTPEANYFQYYQNRLQHFSIEARAGFHKGSWDISSTGAFNFDPEIYSINEKETSIEETISYSYTLGDNFWIGATGPGFAMLNDTSIKGNPGFSLGDDATEAIAAIYAATPALQHYFSKALEHG